jgi:hypothetical protein
LKFGFNANTDATYFKGTIQDLVVYNRELSGAEITTNYGVLSNRVCPGIIPTTTTAAPTTTTTSGPTTTTTTCLECSQYRFRISDGSGYRGSMFYNDCITGVLREVSVSSQVLRKFVGTNPYWVPGGGGGSLTGFTYDGVATVIPSGSTCTPILYDTCSLTPVTGSYPGGEAYFGYYSYVDVSGSINYVDAALYTSAGIVFQQCIAAGALLNGLTYTYSGTCPVCTTTTTTTIAPTTTTTTTAVTSFSGCGYGSTTAGACNDASLNNRTLYSNCNSGTFGVGCFVYVDTFPNALTGYTNVFMNGASWDINSSTGQVTAFSSEQC